MAIPHGPKRPHPAPAGSSGADLEAEIGLYSEQALRNNAIIIEHCRTCAVALGGATAGILGLTGLHGFLYFIFSLFLFWGLLLLKAGSEWEKYFVDRKHLLTNGLFGGLVTYILFWTFLYGMVHVY